jgi:hypothetical protein
MRREPVNTGFDTIRGRDNAPDPSYSLFMRLAIALELSANDFKLPKIELRTTGWVELFVGALGSQAHPHFRTDEAGLATPEKPGDGEPFMPRNTSNAVDVKSVYRPEGEI